MFAGMSDVDVSKFSSPDVGVNSHSHPSMNGHSHPNVDSRPHIASHSLYSFLDLENHPKMDSDLPDLESRRELQDELCISFETYKNRLLYYSTREQLITSGEPGLILIGYWGNKTVFDRTYVSNVLSVKDLQFMISVVDGLENSRQKRKMNKILRKVFMRMGMTEEVRNNLK